MKRVGRFICADSQAPDLEAGFRQIVSGGPWRRDDGQNRWLLFRRRFDADPGTGSCEITADGRYQLFLNGARIGRGPVRCSPYFQRVDRYDLTPHLHSGENVIAVLVHVFGVDTAWYERSRNYWQSLFGDGGLYVHIEIDNGSQQLQLVSDGCWRCTESDAWRRDTPRSGWGQDFIEDFDANRLPPNWNLTDFDDSDWPYAREMIIEGSADDRAKGWGPIEPFPTLLPREIPHLIEAPQQAEAVQAIYRVEPEPGLAIDERIYVERLIHGEENLVESPQALLHDNDACTLVRTSGSHDISLLIRFEQLHCGYPFIELDAQGGEVIELAVAETVPGEYLGEALETVRIARQTYLDCAHVFRYTARAGVQRFEKFEWTAIRYLQLTVRNAPGGLRIRHVGSTSTCYPVENLGAFECSDPMLNQLWETGRYTALQCTHDAREDCPGREKRQWLGDGLVQYLVAAAAFGPSTRDIDRQFLVHGMESQRVDGLLQMFAPGDHHVDGIVIPDFSLHWISTLYYYFQHYGDLETLGELFPTVQKVLAWFTSRTGDDGLIDHVPYWHFIEWADVGREGVSLPMNALFIGALRAATNMAVALGYQRAADVYCERADAAGAALNTRHWDETRGAYVDSVDPESGTRQPKISQQGNALMIFWDIAPRQRWQRILERITDPAKLKITAVPPVVPEGQPFDPQQDVVLANTFFSHFVLGALGHAGRFDLALDQIRRTYQLMLATGTGTLWESFDPAASLCHAFSATPVYQLSRHCLGVSPVTPGCSEVRIAPQPGNLAWVRGTYPTVRGGIDVSWRKIDGGLEIELRIPDGTRAELVPPAGMATTEPVLLEAGSHRRRFQAAEDLR